jgi:membrane fusion protein, multidrug efflux system
MYYRCALLLAAYCCVARAFAAANSDSVELSPQAVQQAAIKTHTLQAARYNGEIQTHATVLDLTPLMTLRQQWLSNQAQQSAAEARRQASLSGLQRTEELYQHRVVSSRQLQEQRAQTQQDSANAAGNRYQQQALLTQARLQWGEKLAHWAIHSSNAELEPWLQGRTQLIQLTLPVGAALPEASKTIWIDAKGQRDRALSATLIDSAPLVDAITQGGKYFYKTLAPRALPVGSHLTAWATTEQSPTTDGVWLPESAVVWQQGQAWAFIEAPAGHFQRLALNMLQRSNQGYVSAAPLQAGQAIVSQGAQTLLSQMLKSQHTHGDDDND